MNDSIDEKPEPASEPKADPVRRTTFILLGVAAFMMVWYMVSDRITPFTSQARVHALVVPVAPQVSGLITEVAVSNNQSVEAGDLLFSIDRQRYELAVETAQAGMQSARQAAGASEANVDAARAQLASMEATLVRARQDAERMKRILSEEPGAVSERRLQYAEATLAVAESRVESAQAGLDRALQDLGEVGDSNSKILQAQAALDQANLDLRRTSVYAPTAGIVTDVRVDRGNFANAGAPLMTFLANHDVWIQADFSENNLGHIDPGDRVKVVFDSLPGKVIKGTVRTTGYGVNISSAPLGSLPTIGNDRDWLRDEQRFAVVVDFELTDEKDDLEIRVGSQASVLVFTGNNPVFNGWGHIKMWIVSLLTFAY